MVIILYYDICIYIIQAAGLDVTTPEPIPADHPLLHMKNCGKLLFGSFADRKLQGK